MWVSSRPLGRSKPARLMRLPSLGISARSAAVSAVVVLVALVLAGVTFCLILYRLLLTGVDDATAGRVRNIVDALHSDSPDDLDSALLTTTQRVVAIQLIAPDGKVVKRAGSAPATPLIPINEFDFNLRRGMPDDAVRNDDLRVSGQKVNAASGQYTVLVGGGSEAVEATVRTVALLVAGERPDHHRGGRQPRPTGSFAGHCNRWTQSAAGWLKSQPPIWPSGYPCLRVVTKFQPWRSP